MTQFFGPLTPNQEAALRSVGPHATWRYLIPVRPRELLRGTIAVTPDYPETGAPVGELAVSGVVGDLAACKPGMDIWIGTAPGLRDVAVLRVRKTPTSGALYVNELGSGDPGVRTLQTHTRVAAGMAFTVAATYNAWFAFPRIQLLGGDSYAIYKDWDWAYSGQTVQPGYVVNIGEFKVGFVDPITGRVEFMLSSVNSYPMTPGAGISSRVWDIGACEFVESGPSDETITILCPPGQHWIACAVTDTNGKTEYGRTLAVALTESGEHAPVRILNPPTSDTRDTRGRRLQLMADPVQMPLSEVPHGALAIYYEVNEIAGAEHAFIENMMVGWAVREQTTLADAGGSSAIELVGPGHMLENVPAVNQRYEAKASPSEWHEAAGYLVNAAGAVWYLLKFHAPPLVELFDVFLLPGEAWGDTAQKGFRFEGGSLAQQLESIAKTLPANIGTTSGGAFIMARHPCHLVARGDVTTRTAFSACDWRSVGGDRQNYNKVGLVYGTGWSFDGQNAVPYRSQAPDLVPGQGAGRATIEAMCVRSQGDLNWATGMEYAWQNNPLPGVQVALLGHRDVVEPAAMQFVVLDVPGAKLDPDTAEGQRWLRLLDMDAPVYDEDEIMPASLRVLPQSVAVEHFQSYKLVTITAAAETYGSPGVTIPIEQPAMPWEPMVVTFGLQPPRPRPVIQVLPDTEPEPPPDEPLPEPPEESIAYCGSYRCRNINDLENPAFWQRSWSPGLLWPGDMRNVGFRFNYRELSGAHYTDLQRCDSCDSSQITFWQTLGTYIRGQFTTGGQTLWVDYEDKDLVGMVLHTEFYYDGWTPANSAFYNYYRVSGTHFTSSRIWAWSCWSNCNWPGASLAADGTLWAVGAQQTDQDSDCERVRIFKAPDYGRVPNDAWEELHYIDFDWPDRSVALYMPWSVRQHGHTQYGVYEEMLLKTTNGWASAAELPPTADGQTWHISDLWIDWKNPNYLACVLARHTPGIGIDEHWTGAAFSANGGQSWTWLVEPEAAPREWVQGAQVRSIGGWPGNADTFLVCGRDLDGHSYIKLTTNRGATWHDRTGNFSPVADGYEGDIQLVYEGALVQ